MPVISTTLFLDDHAIEVDIGIHDFEKAKPQRILVSVELDIDTTEEISFDNIASVLDYDFLRREIHDLISGRRFNLQEVLCREIVAIVARRPEVRAAIVSTRKPDVYADSAAVGVRMQYRRDVSD